MAAYSNKLLARTKLHTATTIYNVLLAACTNDFGIIFGYCAESIFTTWIEYAYCSTLDAKYLLGGHSKTMLTIFCPILTTYLPLVDMFTK